MITQGVGGAQDCYSVSQDTKPDALQAELLKRVAYLLDKAGVEVNGSGSLALDINNNGELEVIGNIQNKDEVAAALKDDDELKQILIKGGTGDSGDISTKSSGGGDIVEISSEAIEAYNKTYNAGVQGDGANSATAQTSSEEINYDTTQSGMAVEKTGKGGSVALLSGNAINKFLGYSEELHINSVIAGINDKMVKLKDETHTLITDILKENEITLSDSDQIDLSVNEDGSIKVTPQEDTKADKDRAKKIEDILNSDSEAAIEIAGNLKEIAVNEESAVELANTTWVNNRPPQLSDSTTLALVELKLGMTLDEAIGKDGKLNTGKQSVADFVNDNPELAERIEHLEDRTVFKDDSSFTLSAGTISNVKQNETLCKDAVGVFNKIVKNTGGLDMGISSYELLLGKEGQITFLNGASKDGGELSSTQKIAIEDTLTKSPEYVPGFNESLISTVFNTMVEDYKREHGTSDDAEYNIKISYDANTSSPSYEIVCSDAQDGGADEFSSVDNALNNDINSYLQEEDGITTPVDIKINDEGKLSASLETLSKAEADKVSATLELINTSVANAASPDKSQELGGQVLYNAEKFADNTVNNTHEESIFEKIKDKLPEGLRRIFEHLLTISN